MATIASAERRVLTAAEYELVAKTYAPALNDLKHRELATLVRWLRQQHAKCRGLDRRRAAKGARSGTRKGMTGATMGPGLAAKMQAFARALARATARLDRLVAGEKRAAMKARMAEALARKRAVEAAPHPPGGRRVGTGPRPIENRKTRPIVKGSRIGSTSQATRNAQARRDKRGKK